MKAPVHQQKADADAHRKDHARTERRRQKAEGDKLTERKHKVIQNVRETHIYRRGRKRKNKSGTGARHRSGTDPFKFRRCLVYKCDVNMYKGGYCVRHYGLFASLVIERKQKPRRKRVSYVYMRGRNKNLSAQNRSATVRGRKHRRQPSFTIPVCSVSKCEVNMYKGGYCVLHYGLYANSRSTLYKESRLKYKAEELCKKREKLEHQQVLLNHETDKLKNEERALKTQLVEVKRRQTKLTNQELELSALREQHMQLNNLLVDLNIRQQIRKMRQGKLDKKQHQLNEKQDYLKAQQDILNQQRQKLYKRQDKVKKGQDQLTSAQVEIKKQEVISQIHEYERKLQGVRKLRVERRKQLLAEQQILADHDLHGMEKAHGTKGFNKAENEAKASSEVRKAPTKQRNAKRLVKVGSSYQMI